MKSADFKTKNSIATFSSLGGECARERRAGVASSMAFLTGVTALAFGLMFALSTPSFATDSLSASVDLIGSGDEDIVPDRINRGIVHTDIGVRATHSGAGGIRITNWAVEALDIGIRAAHSGAGGIRITNEYWAMGNTGIYATHEHKNGGDIVIKNGGHANGSYKFGILDSGGIRIGMRAEHYGTGGIMIDNERDARVFGANIGIRAKHYGTGGIDIKIGDCTYITVEGTYGGYNGDFTRETNVHESYGIQAIHNNAGKIGIDLSGRVHTYDGDPIYMESAGTKTLILRPGFRLESGRSSVKIISEGEGDGILVLDEDDDGSSASDTLNFEDFDFQGFNEFEKFGENTWTIRGEVDDADRFDSAIIKEGTLRFAGDVTFKMSEPEAATDPNYFKIENGAVLEVSGRNNVLEGNLNNLGIIAFKADGEQNSPSTLAVGNGLEGDDRRGGDYKGGGKVVFHASGSDWRADKLKIEGSKDTEHLTEVDIDLTEVDIEAVDSNFKSTDNEELPMVIEVEGKAAATSIHGLVDIDAREYYLQHDHRADEDGGPTMHTWKFVRGGPSRTSGASLSLEEELTAEVDLEEGVTLNPDEEDTELGLRASLHRQSGGVWGRQQSLRTSTGPSLIASRGSRKEGHRVHFGYDTPAMGFMRGDMVVRTSLSCGLSVSDAFSSSGRNRINMESTAAVLTALRQSPGGFYAGGGTRYVRSSSNISVDGFAVARDNDGAGVSASAKAGYRFAVPLGGMDFGVAPQVQLLWSRVGFDDFVGPTGETVSLEDGELVTGRLGLLWDGEWQDDAGSGRIYGKMSLHNAVDGETTVSVSGVPLSRERSELSTDSRLGVSYEWNEGYAVRGEVSALHRDDAEEVRADFGISIDF